MGADFVQKICRERGAALMGVLNVTPDSFSDGGRFLDEGAAVRRVDELLEQGADIVDIGGESSRPGATPVSTADQIARVEPALRRAVERGAVASIDTTDPAVADRMLSLGARIINDVSCLKDRELARVVARYEADLILMHSRDMQAMTGFSAYPENAYLDVVADVHSEWRMARDRASEMGLDRDQIWFDPGVGFAKSARHSFELLRRLAEFGVEKVPIVVGPSRKSFIAALDGSKPEQRLGGTVAACVLAVKHGAQVLRVHDVAEVRQALAVARELGVPGEATS